VKGREAGPLWNEPEGPAELLIRDAEELLADKEMRHRKTLKDCTLPEGFRLVTPEPRQFWMEGQLRWGFKLAWAHVSAQGRGPDEWDFVARYEERVPDEFQMQWAIDEFQGELLAAGAYAAAPQRDQPRVAVRLKLRVEETAWSLP